VIKFFVEIAAAVTPGTLLVDVHALACHAGKDQTSKIAIDKIHVRSPMKPPQRQAVDGPMSNAPLLPEHRVEKTAASWSTRCNEFTAAPVLSRHVT
jgi:hypothetical protein